MIPILGYEEKEAALQAWLAEHVPEAQVQRTRADVLDRGTEVVIATVRVRKRKCELAWNSHKYAIVECGIGAPDAEVYEFTPTDPRQSAVARIIITGEKP